MQHWVGERGESLEKFIERISLNFAPVLLTVLSTIVGQTRTSPPTNAHTRIFYGEANKKPCI